MATRSVLVEARARVALEVACVEQRRWGGGERQSTRGARASTYVRQGYDEPGRQHEVWRRVSGYDAWSPTGSLAERLDRTDDQVRLALRQVRPLAGQCGVMVGIAGQPIALEVFDHPATLAEQLPAIIRAAGLDAAGRPEIPTPGRRARRLVERLERTRLDWEPSVGQDARLGRATTDFLDVMSLRRGRHALHLRATYRRHPILQGA